MRKLHIATTAVTLTLSSLAIAQQQNKVFTPTGSTGSWHAQNDWVPIGAPDLDDDVLIPANKTCTVSGSVNAVAKSIEVETGALLQVEDGLTLQIRTPLSHTFTALRIDGNLRITDASETGVLLVEIPGTGNDVFEMLGDGQLTGDPAELQTSTGDNAVDSIYVGGGTEGGLFVKGTWDIPIDVDNDGYLSAGTGDVMTFFSGSCTEHDIEISGDGTFNANAGTVYFVNPVFETGFDGKLYAWHFGDMVVQRCAAQGGDFYVDAATMQASDWGTIGFLDGLVTDGGSIDLTSDGLLYTDFNEAGDMALDGTVVTVDGGKLAPALTATFTDVTLTIEGDGVVDFDDYLFIADGCTISIDESGQLLCQDNLQMKGQTSITIQGSGELECDQLMTSSPDNVVVTVSGGTLECTWFDVGDTTLTVSGGEFHIIGTTGQLNSVSSNSALTVSGGTFYCGGSVEVLGSLSLSGGVIDVRGDNRFPDRDDLKSSGGFSFTGGKIKVKDDRTVLID